MLATHNAACLCVYAGLSVATSTYNKWVLDRLAFTFPITLSCAHMVGSGFILHAYLAWKRREWDRKSKQEQVKQLSDNRHHPLRPADLEQAASPKTAANTIKPYHPASGDGRTVAVATRHDLAWWLHHYSCYILPIATMFAASVCLRNSAFGGLPLPVMQLLGSCAPLASHALSVAVGLAPLAWPGLACLVACVGGMAIAVSGRATVPYSDHALVRQAAGVGLEVCRSIVLQLFIRKVVAESMGEGGGKGDTAAHQPMAGEVAAVAGLTAPPVPPSAHRPIWGASVKAEPWPTLPERKAPSPSPPLPTILLAMYAPVCAVMLAPPAVAFELDRALADALARPPWFWAALAGNVATALALNLAAVTCLHRVGVVALSLTGFAKNWGLVVVSTVVFGREVSLRFVAGMLVTTAAVGVYGSVRRGR